MLSWTTFDESFFPGKILNDALGLCSQVSANGREGVSRLVQLFNGGLHDRSLLLEVGVGILERDGEVAEDGVAPATAGGIISFLLCTDAGPDEVQYRHYASHDVVEEKRILCGIGIAWGTNTV